MANNAYPPQPPQYPPQEQAPPFTTPPYPQNVPGQPYYPQSGPGVAYYQTSPPQQQSVVVVGSQPVATVVIPPTVTVSFTGAIVLACIVTWCCGFLFGIIAFILAMVGQSSASSGDTNGAHQLLKASYGVSIAGIVITIVIVAISVGVSVSYASRYTKYCYYYGTYGTYYTCY